MWLNKLFIGEPVDFEKRCKTKIGVSMVLAVLGVLAIALSVYVEKFPYLFQESKKYGDFLYGFYVGAGGGLLGAAAATIVLNYLYLKKPELKKKKAIEERDERNRMLGLRTWAYAGYSMFLFLYIGMLFAGLISIMALKVLLIVGAVYLLLLLIFRIILKRCM